MKTLNSGRARFEKLADATLAAGGKMLAGKDAFLLWDTFGYPLDLTQVQSSADVFLCSGLLAMSCFACSNCVTKE